MTAAIAKNSNVTTRATTDTATRKVRWGRYALVALATVVAANVANLIVYYLGSMVVAYNPEFVVLANPVGTLFFTIIPAIGAPIVYAPIRRFVPRPALIFGVISAVILAVSLIPDFTYIPTVPGSSVGQIAILILMHFVAAGVITGMLIRLNAPREQ